MRTQVEFSLWLGYTKTFIFFPINLVAWLLIKRSKRVLKIQKLAFAFVVEFVDTFFSENDRKNTRSFLNCGRIGRAQGWKSSWCRFTTFVALLCICGFGKNHSYSLVFLVSEMEMTMPIFEDHLWWLKYGNYLPYNAYSISVHSHYHR